MNQKKKLLKECAKTLEKPNVSKWYAKKLEGKPQGDTIKTLEKAIVKRELLPREALSVALIVGYQWNVKFEGVP